MASGKNPLLQFVAALPVGSTSSSLSFTGSLHGLRIANSCSMYSSNTSQSGSIGIANCCTCRYARFSAWL
jgi:hypothetical protein